MKKCPICNVENVDDACYCFKCGNKFATDDVTIVKVSTPTKIIRKISNDYHSTDIDDSIASSNWYSRNKIWIYRLLILVSFFIPFFIYSFIYCYYYVLYDIDAYDLYLFHYYSMYKVAMVYCILALVYLVFLILCMIYKITRYNIIDKIALACVKMIVVIVLILYILGTYYRFFPLHL